MGEEHGARTVVDAEADKVFCPFHGVGVEPVGEGGAPGGGDDAIEGGDEGREGAKCKGRGDVVGAEGGVEGGGGVAPRREEGHEAGDGKGAVWGGCGEEEDLWVEPVAGEGLVSMSRDEGEDRLTHPRGNFARIWTLPNLMPTLSLVLMRALMTGLITVPRALLETATQAVLLEEVHPERV